eukprot:191775-Chlamydomonas_euryale.AAC.1
MSAWLSGAGRGGGRTPQPPKVKRDMPRHLLGSGTPEVNGRCSDMYWGASVPRLSRICPDIHWGERRAR